MMLNANDVTSLLLMLLCACAVDGNFNLFMNETETWRLLGIPGDLYYVKGGESNDYALAFNMPIKTDVNEIYFNWQNLRHMPVQPMYYSVLVSVSTQGIIVQPSVSIPREGIVPSKLSLFSMTLVCTGAASGEVDIRMQLNVSIHSPINFTTLDVRRKKACIKSAVDSVRVESDRGIDRVTGRSTLLQTDRDVESLTSSITSSTTLIYVGIGCACAFVILASVAVGFCRCRSTGKYSGHTVSARPMTQPPLQLPIKAQFYRIDTPTCNSVISGPCSTVGRLLTYVSYAELKPSDVETVLRDIHVDRQLVNLGDLLLEGSFGRIYSGTLTVGVSRQQVLIKTVTERARKEQTNAMLRDACLTKGVIHANIAAVIAVSMTSSAAENQPPQPQLFPLVLYAVDGCDCHNLKLFLHRCRMADTPLGVQHLVYVALQINAAIQHLHRRRVLHQDIAARNCLVDSQLHVRLTDNALSRDLFPLDYFQADGECRPVRWMALETLVDGRFSSATDMWSFGVTMWELFTFSQQPYSDVDPLELVDYLVQGCRLCQPPNCPNELYALMLFCWSQIPDERPRFTQMHVRLHDYYTPLAQFV